MWRHMIRHPGLWGGFLISVVAAPHVAAQQDSAAAGPDSAVIRLEQRLEELDQRVRVLDRRRELAADSAAQAARSRAGISAGASGFSLRSADGSFQLRLRGYFQADGRFFAGDRARVLTNDLLIRRARPIIEATIYKYYSFRLMPDFGGSAPAIFDAYFEARFKPEFGVRAGKFKPPVGLERLQSATDVKFAERGLPTNLVPSRDVGLQLSGVLGQGLVSYEAGVFDGVPDLASGNSDVADGKDLVGRLFLTPFARQEASAPVDLGLGIAGSTGKELGITTGTALPAYRSPGQATVFRYRSSSTAPVTGTVIADGRRTRIAPQAYLHRGALGLLAEYTISRQAVARDTGASRQTARLEHAAWQVAGSFFLTGEKNSFRSVTPRRQFDPIGGGWGAVELVARYGEIDFDDDAFPVFADSAASASKAKAWGVGINWHFGRSVRLDIDYERTKFTGGGGTSDRPDEQLIVTRFQTAF